MNIEIQVRNLETGEHATVIMTDQAHSLMDFFRDYFEPMEKLLKTRFIEQDTGGCRRVE